MKTQHCPTMFMLALILQTTLPVDPVSAQSLSQPEARATLQKVVHFYRTQVGYEGAYLWVYAADLTSQQGEGPATRTSGWTQPPGTPAVGEAFLKAWRRSGEQSCLDAAVEAAHALVRSQLKSGGWSSHFELAPEGRKKYAYRIDGKDSGKDNLTTFDDDKTQSALMLLMHVDEARNSQDTQIHEAVNFALTSILAAQYPNGAWPQQYSEPAAVNDNPSMKASFPATWSRTFPKARYVDYYTLNDGNMSKVVDMLLEAHRIYNRQDCMTAAVRTGEFFLLAQLPEPQPGWAQQYDRSMHPAWARKFEPPAVTGSESQGVMLSLITLYRHTGDEKFVTSIPAALAYFRRSQLPDGQLARFYELETNKPLYFTKDYELTYSNADSPTHYSFTVSSGLDKIDRELQEARAASPKDRKPEFTLVTRSRLSPKLQSRAEKVVAELDRRGAWISSGKMEATSKAIPVIETRTLIKNLEALAEYSGATEK